ncbi:MAG TPA: heme peroxidase family protein [Pyrinomonadaceae bacterium]|nr:heme peroxidase family protein [Pyrinomonadaceae bacterium]
MRRHSNRNSYYVVGGEGTIHEHADLFGGCPHLNQSPDGVGHPIPTPQYKFGRLFGRAATLAPAKREQMIIELARLGRIMNEPASGLEIRDSDIPAGYTYLGQFIAHEITFDTTSDIPPEQPVPVNWRSPQIDLDSIYGGGPTHPEDKRMYEADGARLIVDQTIENGRLNQRFSNDLLRDDKGNAIIGDKRNDENLPVAQTHLALVRFHNAVVAQMESEYPPEELFDRARQQVRRHFQWIILYDYLPRIIDKKVLECVLKHGCRWFRISTKAHLFMPLEFSAAAFRLGHSMVRANYEWNYYHASKPGLGGPPVLSELFRETKFSGNLSGRTNLLSEWVIDWRLFYSFGGMNYPSTSRPINLARPINTIFDLRLESISGYPHGTIALDKRSITVRNLLRGFALGLPTGEAVAQWIGETPLTRQQVVAGPHAGVLDTSTFWGETPLWYYILKEAELAGGNRLGPVGSRIVAETLIGILMHSPDSIFAAPVWQPVYSNRKTKLNSVRFEMADLLDFAGVVDPVGPKTPWS